MSWGLVYNKSWLCHKHLSWLYANGNTVKTFDPLWKWKWMSLSHVWLFATPWTIQSVEFSKPEYWSGWPFLSPRDLPNQRIKFRSPALQADSLPAESQGILEWVAYPSSRGSSWPRNQTGVPCIAGRSFANWAIREAPIHFTERQKRKFLWIVKFSATSHVCHQMTAVDGRKDSLPLV